MKTKVLILIIAALCLSAAPAMADIDTGISVVNRIDGYYGGSGGEFTLSSATLNTSAYSLLTKDIQVDNYISAGTGYPPNTNMTTSFQTFCVETDEYVSPPHMVEETWVSWNGTDSYAVAGGKNPGPDPLDPMTAYLYTQFATGALALSATPYDYTLANRASDAVQLHKAIWYIEEEIGVTWDGTKWVQTQTATVALGAGTKALAWYNEAAAAGWNDIGNVRILNLYDHSEVTPLQDQLYLQVPVPGAILLGMLGLSVAGIKLRKFA